MYDYTQDSLNLTNGCYTCMLEEQTCDACLDEQEARRIEMAHQIVENGGDFYYRQVGKTKIAIANSGAVGEKNCMTVLSDEPSGHDWVSAHVYLIRPAIQMDGTIREIRDEFTEPTSLLSDRLFELDVEVPVGYTVCADCHYMCNASVKCPNCEEVNA